MDDGRGAAKRFVPLKADAAAQALALALRFGGPASLQSTGQVLISELLASSADRAELRRAQVVDHVFKRQPNAPSEIAALPRDLFALTVEGEYWLRVENFDNAISSWTEAVSQKRCAWTVFGLARAYIAANQLAKALDAANQVIELNPEHVGAKLLLVDSAVRGGTFEPSALATLQAVLGTPGLASPSEVTLAHTLRGEFEFGTGKTSSAVESFEAALAVVPGDARALASSARALFSSGRHAAALARFQSAVTAAPEALAPQVGVARTQIALDQLDQAVLLIQTLRQTHPTDIEVAYLSGAATLASGELETGRKVLQEAIDLSKQPAPPRFAPLEFQRVAVESYVALATSFTKAGEPERAAPILAQAAAELPGSGALRVATGDVAFGQGQFEKALSEYSEARKLAMSDSAAIFKEGQALSRLRRFEEARASFDKVAEIDANYPGLPLERGLILDKSGKAAEALAEYEQALKHDPADVDVQLRVGCGRVEAGQGASAAAVLKDVLAKRSHSAEANYCLGRAMFAQNSTVEALRLMRAAVEYDSNSAIYRLHLGWIASEMGQVAVARRELNRALELDQGSVDAYWQRGLLNLKQGAARDATVDFKKALELNPTHLGANADMAQALAQLGKEGDAIPFWEKAIAGDANNSVWLFRFGKILVGRNQREKGTELLLRALKLVDGESPAPNWLWQAHYLAALGLGGSANAVQHWRRYLELSPHDSPYRSEAKRILAKAGQPWEGQ
jgi:tetratricopeptide (TPR) repeat protein